MSSVVVESNAAASGGVGTSTSTGGAQDLLQHWNFDRDAISQSSSLRGGMSPEEELRLRQQAAACIQEMTEALNANVRDQRNRISHLCQCVAIVQMHRFFYFHSFKSFDYRDVAAACLFMAGKSEECPRKLELVVRVWWQKKFDHPIPSQNHGVEAAQLLVQLENLILRTIGFELSVELPHKHVLSMMPNGINPNEVKNLASSAYYFATDILCMTNWPIRYSSRTIATACVYIVCVYGNIQIPTGNDNTAPWYKQFDKSITLEQLKEMADEFTLVYQACKDHLVIRSTFLKPKGPSATSNETGDDASAVATLLPPPPPPPMFTKKINIKEYNERLKEVKEEVKDSSASSTTATDTPFQPPKKSFIPDTTQVTARSLEPGNGQGSTTSQNGSSGRKEHKEHYSSSHRHHHSSSGPAPHPNGEKHKHKEHKHHYTHNAHHKREALSLPSLNSSSLEHKEARLESDRRKEEERRKREYEKMSGASMHGIGSEKRPPQIESLKSSFIPASEPPRSKIKLPMSGGMHPAATLISPPPQPTKLELEDGEVAE